MKRLLLQLLTIGAFCVALQGCESITVKNMVSDKASVGTRHPQTIAVSVTGGSAGVKAFSGTVKPQEFEEALRMSLEQAPLFARILDDKTADYLLKVNLTYAASHPGFNMTAWINADWFLIERTSGREAWAASIKAEGHATVGDAFSGAKRQYMAIERGVKANIDEGLSKLGSLPSLR